MASGNMKTIKRRIKSVGSTMQITKAMELVASSKLRRAKKKARKARPYFDAQYRMLTEILQSHSIDTEFTRERKKSGCCLHIVIAGDRGLAGGYNSGMFKLVASEYVQLGNEKSACSRIIAIGKKSVEHFEKRNYNVISKYIGLAENVKSGHCSDIANAAIQQFLSGEVDEVKLFYTKFVSSMAQEAVCLPLLPVKSCQIGLHMSDCNGEVVHDIPKEITYDPNPQAVFNRLVPCFLTSIIQCAITDSYTSEQCARRIAMENASENAEEMIENLSLLYNRARQEKITNEINEIVGGANAL